MDTRVHTNNPSLAVARFNVVVEIHSGKVVLVLRPPVVYIQEGEMSGECVQWGGYGYVSTGNHSWYTNIINYNKKLLIIIIT